MREHYHYLVFIFLLLGCIHFQLESLTLGGGLNYLVFQFLHSALSHRHILLVCFLHVLFFLSVKSCVGCHARSWFPWQAFNTETLLQDHFLKSLLLSILDSSLFLVLIWRHRVRECQDSTHLYVSISNATIEHQYCMYAEIFSLMLRDYCGVCMGHKHMIDSPNQ